MDADDKREIVQLWWAGRKYFKMAEDVREDLSDDDLQLTVKQLANKCEKMSDIKGVTALQMKLNAHLGSCAIRLYSIDEKCRGMSVRWSDYESLKNKKDALTVSEVLQKKETVVHFLLRHNVAHEEDATSKIQKHEKAYKTMQDALQELKIEQLYENMRLVRDEMEKELAPIISK